MNAENQRQQLICSRFQPSTMLEAEKLGIYQVSKLVKMHSNHNRIQLKNDEGVLCNNDQTKQMVYDHYRHFFDESKNHDNTLSMLDSIRKTLSDNSKQLLMEPITEDELYNTIKSSTMKKSPGPDGITYEFYLVHFALLKKDLLKLFNGIYSGEIVPIENFSSGIVTLIPKVGNKYDLNNYRPISLLNSDYKLFCKIIANRLKTYLEELIEEGQTAGIKNKSCTDNLDIIRTMVVKAQQSKKFKFALLSLDLEKAFDMVSHRRLWQTLEKFQLPEQLIKCIKQLYGKASSRILINGFLSPSFKIKRSVRQGCPLSMLLFSLYIEPLIRHLNSSISGILICNRFVRVLAFADDLTLILRNDSEFDAVMHIIENFTKFADIKLNVKKSGFLRYNNCKLGPQLVAEKNELKILGIVIDTNYKKMVENNFAKIIRSVNATTQVHMSRRLSLLEKVIVLNTYILSKLWYVSQTLPPSNIHLAQIKKTSGYFLWGCHRIFKIERTQLYLHNLKGGLNLLDPETQCKSLFIRSILFKGYEPVNHYFTSTDNLKGLSLNTQRFITKANEIKRLSYLTTNKQIYDYFIDRMCIKVKMEEKYPQICWNDIWENINKNFLTLSTRSTLYEMFNDIIPNNIKMFNNIANVDDFQCDICGKPDDNIHRVTNCLKTSEIWLWVLKILKDRFEIRIESPLLLLYKGISKQNSKFKAALWLICEAIAYNVKNHKNPSLFMFQKRIRDTRWNNNKLFKKHFGNYLNIC